MISQILYLIAASFFILSLKGLSSANSSRNGNLFGIIGMVIAIVTTLFHFDSGKLGLIFSALIIGATIGIFIAKKISMSSLPQLVAAFHSLVGLSAVLVALATVYAPQIFNLGTIGLLKKSNLIELGLGSIIGAITFTGSVIAFLKLQGLIKNWCISCKSSILPMVSGVTIGLLVLFILTQSNAIFVGLTLSAFLLGIALILPVGGADMPVVVSMLNSYSGWAATATGFVLNNHLLIITGALVGSSGAILSYIMCKNMNRSLINVLLGGSSTTESKDPNKNTDKSVKISGPEDAAFILSNASSVIIVPGYGMAVAQAQHALYEMANILKSNGIKVRYAVHPVAGRMPGHMNVLLAEAKVQYDDVFELEDINTDFATTDVAFVIGANDITNPAAHNDPSSPIFGMPILDVEKSKTVLFVKRSLGSGYAGIDNELFYNNNTMMVLGDAKKVCEGIVKNLN